MKWMQYETKKMHEAIKVDPHTQKGYVMAANKNRLVSGQVNFRDIPVIMLEPFVSVSKIAKKCKITPPEIDQFGYYHWDLKNCPHQFELLLKACQCFGKKIAKLPKSNFCIYTKIDANIVKRIVIDVDITETKDAMDLWRKTIEESEKEEMNSCDKDTFVLEDDDFGYDDILPNMPC